MKITIYTKTGKLKSSFSKLFEEYKKRCSPYCKIEIKKDINTLNKLLQSQKSDTYTINIKTSSKLISSEELANTFSDLSLKSKSKICLFLDSKEKGFDNEISILSSNTSENILVSVLLEQIFRAFTIINGRPYHK